MINITNNKLSAIRIEQQLDYKENEVAKKVIIKNTVGHIVLFAFDTGTGLDQHTAPYTALIQALEGEAEIRFADYKIVLKKGDSFIMPPAVEHSLYATTRFKMLLTLMKG